MVRSAGLWPNRVSGTKNIIKVPKWIPISNVLSHVSTMSVVTLSSLSLTSMTTLSLLSSEQGPISLTSATQVQLGGTRNPIKMVIQLLEDLHKEIEDEGRTQEKLFQKLKCGCDKDKPSYQQTIDTAGMKIEDLNAQIQERIGSISGLKTEIGGMAKDLASDKVSLKNALQVREKEASDYKNESKMSRENIAALDQAIPAIRNNMGDPASFLQTSKPALQKLLQNGAFTSDTDREIAWNFLENRSASGGAGSGEILGILEQMRDTMKSNLLESTKTEDTALATFKQLLESKQSEISAAESDLVEHRARMSTQEGELAQFNEDLIDNKTVLEAATKQLADKTAECKDGDETYAQGNQDRQDEQSGINAAVKILASDDADDVLHSTVQPIQDKEEFTGESFLQVRMTAKSNNFNLLASSTRSASKNPQKVLQADNQRSQNKFLSSNLSLSQQKGSNTQQKSKKFAELSEQCQKSIATLKREQKNEDIQLESCQKDIQANKLAMKDEDKQLATKSQEKEQKEVEKTAVSEELAGMVEAVKELVKSTDTETNLRNEQHENFLQVSTELSQAVDLLNKAAKKLEETYAGKSIGANNLELLQQQSEQQQSEQQQQRATLVDEDVLLGFSQMDGEDPQSDRKEKGAKITAMLVQLANKVELDLQRATQDEEHQKSEYENVIADNKEILDDRYDSQTTKKVELAKIQTLLTRLAEDVKQEEDEISGLKKEREALDGSCGFLLENHESRKNQREEEIANLTRAIAILKGANFD